MHFASSSGSRPAIFALLVAVGGFCATYAGSWLTQDAERIASIWPGNALVLAALLMLPRAAWKLVLPAAISGYFLANLTLGDTLLQALGLAAANGAEVLIGGVLMRHSLGEACTDMSRRWMTKLIVFGGLAGCVTSATLASLVLGDSGQRFAEVWTTYFPAHLIGIVTLTPVILALTGPRDARTDFRIGSSLWQIGLLSLVVAVGLFAQGTTPLLYLMFPVLVFAAFRGGIVGAAGALFVFTTVATAFTLRGFGPISVIEGGGRVQIVFLQILILVATLTTMPIGFALADRKAALQRAKLLAEEADVANSAKSRFLANMSHEIRTPLNGVLGSAELLGASPLVAGQKRQVEMIQQSASTLLQLLNDILDLSKVEAGQMRVVEEPMQLAKLFDDCADLIRPLAQGKGVELDVDIEPGLPQWMVTDHLRFRQIMLNLLGNSVKFSQSGTITITARSPSEGCLLVSVADQGIGIPACRIDSLFTDFVQAHDSTAHSYGGTGLGLAISKKLAQLMGGDLRLESALGEGTIVMLDLPLVAAAAPELVTDEVFDAKSARQSHILLVDDIDINREIVGTMLHNQGHSFATAANGIEAIAAAEQSERDQRQFDAVLMDVRMPQMDGLEATRIIKARPSSSALPIVGLTANAFDDELERCHASGMTEVISKPVSIPMLGAALVRVLGERAVSNTDEPVRNKIAEASLQDRYEQRKLQALRRIEELILKGELEYAALKEIADLAHNLAGSGGMFGDGYFGDRAYDFEQKILTHLDRGKAEHDRVLLETAFANLTIAA